MTVKPAPKKPAAKPAARPQNELQRFINSIVTQESGGNYAAQGPAVNGDHAYGKYQVMGANIPQWTEQALGRSLTPAQYLASPAAQDAVAKWKLTSYYHQYGVAGAAAAWYSGDPSKVNDTSPQSGGPSIHDYVQSVVGRVSGKGASTATGVDAAKQGQNLATATGTDSIFGSAAQTFNKQQLAQLYGFASSFFSSDPSLENLIGQAIKGGYSADQFKALLQGTSWYKKYSDSQKQWIQLSTGDPAEAKRQLQVKQDTVARTAQSLGVSLTPAEIQQFAHQALYNGMTDQQVQFGLAQHLYQQQSSATGSFGATIQQLRQATADYGLNYSDGTLRNKAADILGGKDSVDGFKATLADAAGTKYTGIAAQLKDGKTVADVAQPFIEQMASTLELDPASINIQDQTIQKALSYRQPGAGGVVDPTSAPGVQPMWDFERALKDDPRWASTSNAKNTIANAGYALGKSWGVGGF